MALAAAFAAFLATLFGGMFALRLKERRHLILGFSAGAVFGVAFFDLLPAAFTFGAPAWGVQSLLAAIAFGFFAYLAFERYFLSSSNKERSSARGFVGAAVLSAHSFLEGIGIGLGFEASPAIGFVVALAVIAHDFSDGINVVNMVLGHDGSQTTAQRLLLADAFGPALGVGAASLLPLPGSALGMVLAIIGGFFVCVAGTDLIPGSFRSHPRLSTTILTLIGAALMFAVTSIAG